MNIHVPNVCLTAKPSFIIANTLDNTGLGGFMDEFRIILTNIYCVVFTDCGDLKNQAVTIWWCYDLL
mgnify:FL=1